MQVLVIFSLKIPEKKSYSCILFHIRAMKFRIGGADLQKCAMWNCELSFLSVKMEDYIDSLRNCSKEVEENMDIYVSLVEGECL